MPNWTKVLHSTAHGKDVAKRRDPNRPKVGLVGPTSWPVGKVFTLNESSLLHTCHWRTGDKESRETRAVQPNVVAGWPCVHLACLPSVPRWCQFLPQRRPPAPINTPLLHSVKGRTKSVKVASTSASTSRFYGIDRGVRF
jgi:hypothetical protein